MQMIFSYSGCPIGEPVFTRLQHWKTRIRRKDDQVFLFVKNEVFPAVGQLQMGGKLLSGSIGTAWRCRRMVLKIVWLLGSWPAESKGKDLITVCKMVLDGCSLSAARALILFLRLTTGARLRFGAWQCSVGPETIAYIVGFVWQPVLDWDSGHDNAQLVLKR